MLVVGFDHSSIILNLNFVDIKPRRLFKFEAMQIDEEYRKSIKKGWELTIDGSWPVNLVQKLKKCK